MDAKPRANTRTHEHARLRVRLAPCFFFPRGECFFFFFLTLDFVVLSFWVAVSPWFAGKPAGSSIDAHDVVVRLNQAPTKSYAPRVGSKATWRVLNKSWVIGYGGLLRREHGSVTKADLPNEKGVHMLASRGNAQAVKKLFAELRTPRYRANGVAGVRMNFKLYDVISGQLRRFRACMASEGTKFPGGSTPSTGVMTALLLAGQCEELNLYGFGAPIVRGKYQYYTLRNSQRWGMAPRGVDL